MMELVFNFSGGKDNTAILGHGAFRRNTMAQIPAPIENKLYFLRIESDCWNDMWDRFVQLHKERFGTPDAQALNKEYGECWQYMGTVHKPSGEVEHQFRHRMHPKTLKREYVCIRLSQMYDHLWIDLATE